jgi:transposase
VPIVADRQRFHSTVGKAPRGRASRRSRLEEMLMKTFHKQCAGLDVRKGEVFACLRVVRRGKGNHEVRRFPTTTQGLFELGEWLKVAGCTHVAVKARGVHWKPVWHILQGQFKLLLACAAQKKGLPGRKSDVNEAAWIADLLAHFLLRANFVPPNPHFSTATCVATP